MHIYKYVQLHTVTLHPNVSVAPVTIIRVSYSKNALSTQIFVQKCMIKPVDNIRWCYRILKV